MTGLLREAFALPGQMPPAAQDDIARALIGRAHETDPLEIEPEHRDAVLEGLAQAERDESAQTPPDASVAAAFARVARSGCA